MATIETKTNCPICGAECKIGVDSETHFYIPVSEGEIPKKKEYSLDYFKDIVAKKENYDNWEHFFSTNNDNDILIRTEVAAELYDRHKFEQGAKKVLSNISETFLDPNNQSKALLYSDIAVFQSIGETIKNFPTPTFE